ncbi:hypothetical protein [Allomuricauda sp. CP2A]|uniref:hypothetical protein n=1 Tax=Allomuricauda sp. CP2A TaxID=1848189 RepID=UPI0009F60AF3|nr:hypothetical protein [Muricauda sp. CP2A]
MFNFKSMKDWVMVVQNKIENLHNELQKWKSHLQFIEGEMSFIQKLLNSYVFEPRTPNLFERLEQFKQEFLESKKEKELLKKQIRRHESHLGGIFECTSEICDVSYYEKHNKLQNRILNYLDDYLNLKNKVYSYAGSVLKRRKPVD